MTSELRGKTSDPKKEALLFEAHESLNRELHILQANRSLAGVCAVELHKKLLHAFSKGPEPGIKHPMMTPEIRGSNEQNQSTNQPPKASPMLVRDGALRCGLRPVHLFAITSASAHFTLTTGKIGHGTFANQRSEFPTIWVEIRSK